MGLYHEDGLAALVPNLVNAFHYYSLVADRIGHVEGMLAVARMRYHGRGVERGFESAFEYYEQVASRTTNAVACFMLGRMLQPGEGVQKDSACASRWVMKAVAMGSVYAMVNMALLDAEEGRWLHSISWRLRAGVSAFLIARKDPRDKRLRDG